MKNIISIPITRLEKNRKVVFENVQSDLTPVKLYVCCTGKVPSHDIYFEKKAIESDEAKNSIKNKPLLCAYEKDEQGKPTDFKGHEYDYKFVTENGIRTLKIVYEEQPVGIIPETNNYTLEVDSRGETWIVVEAYIFNEYCDDAVRIIEDNNGIKSISMEIEVLDSHEDEEDGLKHIDLFKFQGVTLLGAGHRPAIDGAYITSDMSNSIPFEVGYKKIVSELKKFEEKGERVKLRNKLREKFSYISKLEGFEDILKNEKFTDEEVEKKLFELSSGYIENLIRDSLVDLTCKKKYSWGEEYISRQWFLEDLKVVESIAILMDNSDNHYYFFGVPYTISGDSATLDFEAKTRYIRGDWREFQEGDKQSSIIEAFEEEKKAFEEKLNKTNEELKTAKVSCSEANGELESLKESFEKLESENKTLKDNNAKFEADKLAQEVDKKLEKYEKLSNLEGYKEIVSLKLEKPFEELEKDLKVLAYDNGITIKSSKKESFENKHITIPLDNGNDNSSSIPVYGGILDRHCSVNK